MVKGLDSVNASRSGGLRVASIAPIAKSTPRHALVVPTRTAARCIALMGFGAWLDPFEVQRFAFLAQLTEVPFVVPEAPGLGSSRTSLTTRERFALLRGRFDRTADRMLEAVDGDLGGNRDGAAGVEHLLGYSMGASMAAAMVASHPGRFASLTLVEPVGFRRWHPLRLLEATRDEDDVLEDYLTENAGIPGSEVPTDRTPGGPPAVRSSVDQLMLSTALMYGRTRNDLLRIARQSPQLPVMVMHGDSSVLSPSRDVVSLTDELQRAGLVVRDVVLSGGHGLWQSLPRVESLAGDLRRFWDTTE